ncbi:hypothetical protein MKX01_002359 [Papaver californicum]|nr:hypothetical protein MKX01_002359 [Papaver californicum]
MVSDDDERESEGYLNLARDIEVMKPKSPEDIYKAHLVGGGGATAGASVDLARYFHSDDPHVISGALLGVGIVNSSVKQDCDPAMAPLSDYINKKDSTVPYAGTQNEQLDVIAFTAISLSLVFVGSCNADPLTRLLPLGLGVLYLGKQESVEATAEVSKTFHEKIRKYCDMTLLSYDYAGTGNVLKIHHILGECGQHVEKDETHLGHFVLGIAMNTRRAVALALGLFCISNPKVNVMDTLSKLSHGADTEVTMAATISLGLIGAGTNNAPIAGMLRNLSSYYSQDTSLLFCGLLTLSPHHSERFLLSPTSLAGLIIMLHTCLDMKSFILGK